MRNAIKNMLISIYAYDSIAGVSSSCLYPDDIFKQPPDDYLSFQGLETEGSLQDIE